MNTEQIVAAANKDQLAASDLDLDAILRQEVMPAFFADVGDVKWRRANTTVSLVAPTRQYSMPDDFYKVTEIYLPPVGAASFVDKDRISNISESPHLVAKSEWNTAPGKPTGYYVVQRLTGTPPDYTFRAIKFDTIPDMSYTAYVLYLKGCVFTDLQTVVDLDQYCPPMLQPTIISRLRMEIMRSRYGQKDTRFSDERDEYTAWLGRCSESRDMARRGDHKVYAR